MFNFKNFGTDSMFPHLNSKLREPNGKQTKFLAGFMPHNVAIQSTPFQNLELCLIQQCILKDNLFFLDKI